MAERGGLPAWAIPFPHEKPWWREPWMVIPVVFFVALICVYWYVAVPLLVIAVVAAVLYGRRVYRQREFDRLRAAADEAYRRGEVMPPRPPWENGGTMAS